MADPRSEDALDAATIGARPTPGGPAAEAALPLGTEIAGRYRLLEVLGRGGMGVVYRARDRLIDADVAMKWIRPPAHPERSAAGGRAESKGRGLDAVRDEVRLARLVSHPSVCRLHDMVDDAEHGTFLTMEYVAGESLAHRLASGKPLPPAEALRLLGQICDGLAAAHAAGVIHRDLKPSNVLVREDGRAVIADFGIAARAGGGAEAAGTRGFMAPEQAGGGAADARSDVYALGAIGGALGRSLPEPVAQLMAACRAEDPAARPADAGAVARRLHLAAGSARSLRGVAIGVGIVVVISGAGAYAALRSQDHRAAADAAAVAVAAPELIQVDASAGELLGDDAWLPAALAALTAAEIDDAWGIPARTAGGADRPGIARVTIRLSRDPGGRLIAAVTAGGAPLDDAAADTPRALAEQVAARTIAALVPAAEQHPTADELARAGASSADAWRDWRRGQRASRMQRPDLARVLFARASKADPQFPLPWFELALTYPFIAEPAASAAFARAGELASKATGVDPMWPAAFAVVRAAATDDPELPQHYQRLLRLPMSSRDRLQIEIRWAQSAVQGGATMAAGIALMEKVAETWPHDAAAAKFLARMYVGPSDLVSTARALHFGARAAALAPDDVGVHADLARALLLDGKRPEAEARARIAERGDPADKQADAGRLFQLHMALGDLEEAAADARRGLGTPETTAQATLWLAYVDLRRGAFVHGLDGMQRAVDQLDRTGQALSAALNRIEIGWMQFLLGDAAAARRSFAAAIRPGTVTHATVMAKLSGYVAGGRREPRLLAAARAALKGPQADPLRLFLELVIAHVEGQWAEVVRLQRLQSVDGSRLDGVYLAGDALEQLGRHDEALAAFAKIADHPGAWVRAVLIGESLQRIGALREQAGDRAGALAAYRRVTTEWARADVELPRLRLARDRLRALDGPVDGPARPR